MTADAETRDQRWEQGPQRLTALLIKLGPLFVKIGQFLALRPDLLPQQYCDELLRLVDRAPTIPWEDIASIVAEELGAAPENIFAFISKRPLSAGSIAQVHLAETKQGEKVAVKVQRPNLAEHVERDLRRVRLLARLLDSSGVGPLTSARETVDEIARWLHEELDFKHELRNQTHLYHVTSPQGTARIPRPFPELSGRRVLTAEHLAGVPFSELVRLRRGGEITRIESMRLDFEALGKHLIETAFHQIFTLRRFHADPHPGNLIAMADNVIGFVDFGLTDVLPKALEEVQFDYLAALYNHDVRGMYRAISKMIEPGPESDSGAFRCDFMVETTRWLTLIEDEASDTRPRSSTAGYMVLLMQLARRHRMRVPTSILSMYRTLLTAESVAHELDAGADLRSVGRRFFADAQVERFLSTLEPKSIFALLMQLTEFSRSTPSHLHELLSDVAEGRFVLPVQNEESAHARRAANQRARLLTLAILSTGLALLLAVDGLSGAFGQTMDKLLWGGLAGIYAWMALIWWRMD
jgi:ubiquinone biosynthesis protein